MDTFLGILRNIIFVLLLGMAIRGVASMVRNAHQRKPAESKLPGAGLTLEQKLAKLAECGLVLTEPFDVSSLLESWPRSDYEEPGYMSLLFGLSGTEEREPWRHHGNALYHFDMECVEDPHVYTEIVLDLAAMTQGDLAVSDIVDDVEYGCGDTVLSLKCNGRQVQIDVHQDNDWFDEHVVECLAALLNNTGSKRVFFLIDTGDQNAMIGCLPREQVDRLASLGISTTILTTTLPHPKCRVL